MQNLARIQELSKKVADLERSILIKQKEQEIAEIKEKLNSTKINKEETSSIAPEVPDVNDMFCDQADLDERTNQLTESIKFEFNRIVEIAGIDAAIETKIMDDTLWVTLRKGNTSGSLRVPLPKVSSQGLIIIKNKDVVRTVCDFWMEDEQKKYNYHDIMMSLFCRDIHEVMPALESGSPLIHKIVKSFEKGQFSYIVSSLQKLINEIVVRMPLYETDMNGWAMNHRIMIIDREFDIYNNPDDRLNYQVEKNNKYYSKFGWTSIGLSDGVLADKNYLLTTDLRKLTPFNLYHNPQRNLYSTLGMTGDELPRIRTKSMQKLIDRGITRTGWNMVTAVMDVPLNFEDQILVDKRHKGLSHTKDRRFIIYGNRLRVKIGDSVKYGQILGHSNDGQSIRMNLRCDSAKVVRIRKDWVETSGMRSPILVITVRAKRFLRDGTKFSNLHGNKGIVRFVDLGYAIDPRNGNEVPIDIMISAKSVNKRKNFGQILEALFNNTHEGTDPIVIEDDFSTEKETAQRALEDAGFPRDGVWHIDTFCGEYEAIVGRIFWGVTKDGEDATWEEDRTILTNNRELRTSGLKFSHVEMKALTTRFGPNNAIIKEILSHTQGSEILQDEIRVLKSAAGEIDKEYPVIDAKDIKTVDITKGLFHPVEDIKGTVVDDEYFPEGFTLQLPLYFQVLVNKNDHSQFTWGLPQPPEDNKEKFTEYLYNKIFIPNALLRRCWCHPSGNWGMNTLGAMINRIVLACHKYMENTESSFAATEVASAIGRYFSMLAKSMGTKKGELATYGMSVRYPFSVRGTAVLSENLPKDTVEIHTEMAKVLKVKNGDVIIAERFPCLGFVSIRPQFVSITDDPQCKHVIRVSGNSLVSMSLDFDGDTLFLASFFSPEAITVLREEMVNPNPICKSAIERINNNKVPIYSEMTIDDFEIHEFPRPTVEEHGELVRNAAGVKSHTGPVIALAYNLMRIVEANVPYENTEAHANLELLLDFLGNTVFKQKHGIKSLQEEATDAICCADVEKMVELGFERAPSNMLCELIRKEAASIRIRNLKQYHMEIAKPGLGAKVINIIVRKKHKLYFASRAQLGPFALLDHLKSPAVDLPSSMLVKILKSKREKIEDKIERLKSERMDAKADRMNIKDVLETNAMKRVYRAMSAYIDRITKKSTEVNDGL